MIQSLLILLLRLLLSLRYRVRVRGLREISRRGRGGVLFLPNHPALIDPIILMSVLYPTFRPRALADRDQLSHSGLGRLFAMFGVIPMPDVKVHGAAVRDEIDAARRVCVETLQSGGNVLIYPSGHIYRTRHEDLRGNSGAEELLRAAPEARVVVVTTHGLWGSSLSMASGEVPPLGRWFRTQAWNLLINGLLFMPRREVTIDLSEPDDLPRDADRRRLNAWLEARYNADAPPATRVAYRFWESPVVSELPDPEWGATAAELDEAPAATRRLVEARLCELAGVSDVHPQQELARDLGLDSLARAELLMWLTREFGTPTLEGDAVRTVADAIVAACGHAVTTRPTPLQPTPPAWWTADARREIQIPDGRTITDVFLEQARRRPGALVIADQRSGGRSYRDLVTAIMVLQPILRKLPGETIGIMLPASVGATTIYLAALFAGKRPLMVNWTTGVRNMHHVFEMTGVMTVLTAGELIDRLRGQGLEIDQLKNVLQPVERLAAGISKWAKLWAALRARVSWRSLRAARPHEHAVVLVTSGSESLPKAVPLTHANVLANLRDITRVVALHGDDRLLGFLPPFHSFGLTVCLVMPLLTGIRTVYHANPTQAFTLARLIAAYRVSLLLGTPTFVNGILRAARRKGMLDSLRLAVTGAEKCPERVYDALERQCPNAVVAEGYGITECSPIVAVNRVEAPRRGTIGKLLPSFEAAIVDPETEQNSSPTGNAGLLLVRGPSVFPGYLGTDSESPFVNFDGRSWYRTGDLVSIDQEGVLTFRGRLKRFVKIGGEMISLPAVEAALEPHLARPSDEGPALAVVAHENDSRPELILVSIRPIDRKTANDYLREAGLSALHNLTRVMQADEIPMLGNGKTDYRGVQKLLSDDSDGASAASR